MKDGTRPTRSPASPVSHLEASAAKKSKYREHDDDDQDDEQNAERWPPFGVVVWVCSVSLRPILHYPAADTSTPSHFGEDPVVGHVRAAIGSVVFLAVAPGITAGLVPWLLTGWDAHPWWLPLRFLGAVVVVAGALILLQAFARFVLEGLGTPAPVAPPERLVVGGLYRYVRNPMYLAVAATILGQALLLGRPRLLVYAGLFLAIVAAFVRWYEEPTLAGRFGAEYEEYRRTVRGWLPRARCASARSPRCARRDL